MDRPTYRIIEEHDLSYPYDFITIQKKDGENWITVKPLSFIRNRCGNAEESERSRRLALGEARKLINSLRDDGYTMKVIETYEPDTKGNYALAK